jgi:hypothetical protein
LKDSRGSCQVVGSLGIERRYALSGSFLALILLVSPVTANEKSRAFGPAK